MAKIRNQTDRNQTASYPEMVGGKATGQTIHVTAKPGEIIEILGEYAKNAVASKEPQWVGVWGCAEEKPIKKEEPVKDLNKGGGKGGKP